METGVDEEGSTGTSGSGSTSEETDGTTFDRDSVTSCADLNLDGFCIDVYTPQELIDTRQTCPYLEACRVVVHPGLYEIESSNFTYHHWYRHYIGVLDEEGLRPVIRSTGTSVFANKGNEDYHQNTILQNLVLTGTSMGVDFDGSTEPPYETSGGFAWLDNVKIDVDSRGVLFNTGAADVGGGWFWCTECEIHHRPSLGSPTNMIAIGNIDLAWLSDTRLIPESWSNTTLALGARSVGLEAVVDGSGAEIACGDWEIDCADGPSAELLRRPTIEWFEGLIYEFAPGG